MKRRILTLLITLILIAGLSGCDLAGDILSTIISEVGTQTTQSLEPTASLPAQAPDAPTPDPAPTPTPTPTPDLTHSPTPTPIPTPTSNEQGNNVGNINNQGLFAGQGDWIYYNSSTLHAIRTDGTGKQKISDDYARFINVIGDRVYYIGGSDYNGTSRIYSVRTDGTDRQKLGDDEASHLIVVRDYIYYANWSDKGKLYVMRTDGTGRQMLSDDIGIRCINVIDDDIYYIVYEDNYYDQALGRIYAIRTDGTNKRVLNDEWSENLVVADGMIYYVTRRESADSWRLRSMRTDGTDMKTIFDGIVWSFNVTGDRIYFSDGNNDDALCSMRTDGTDKKQLTDDISESIHVVGDYIFYDSFLDYALTYEPRIIRTDGTDRQLFDW